MRFLLGAHDRQFLGLNLRHGQLHHAHRAFNNFKSRRHHGRRLLTLQHGRGNFWRVTQTGDAAFQHFNARATKTAIKFFFQFCANQIRATAQACAIHIGRVVVIAACQIAQRGLALNLHIALVILHGEERLGCINNAPHNHRRNINWVAVKIVHLHGVSRARGFANHFSHWIFHGLCLKRASFKCAHAQRDLFLGCERIRPVKSNFANRAAIVAKQHHCATFIGSHHKETSDTNTQRKKNQHGQNNWRRFLLAHAVHENGDVEHQNGDPQRNNEPARKWLEQILAKQRRTEQSLRRCGAIT